MWPLVRSTLSPGGPRYAHNELCVSGIVLSPAGIADVSVTVDGSTYSATRARIHGSVPPMSCRSFPCGRPT